jgi:hypothetical protein
LNVILFNEEDKKNYSVCNTPNKPSTQYRKDRNEYLLVVAAVMVNTSKRPRNYFTSHVKGRFKDWGKLYQE